MRAEIAHILSTEYKLSVQVAPKLHPARKDGPVYKNKSNPSYVHNLGYQ